MLAPRSRGKGFRGAVLHSDQRHLSTFVAQRDLCRLFISEVRIASDYRGSAIQQLNRRYTSILIKMVDDAVASGEIPQAIDPRVVRDMMFGAIEHSAWRHTIGKRPLDVQRMARTITDIFLNGLCPNWQRRSRNVKSWFRSGRRLAVQAHSDCQSRRDRVAHLCARASATGRQSWCTPRRTPTRCRAVRRRRRLHRPRAGPESYLNIPRLIVAAARATAPRGPPRLWLPLRERGLRGQMAASSMIHRSDGRPDPDDGRQGRRGHRAFVVRRAAHSGRAVG